MLDKKSWKEFKSTKLLWWVNRSLHLFGWCIVIELDANHNIIDVYPARTNYRGFNYEDEENGFKGLSMYLKNNINDLEQETHE